MRAATAPILHRKKGRITVVCKGCGETFETINSQIVRRSGGKFCSRTCFNDYRATHKQTRLAKLLKQLYQMTEAEYQSLLDAQGGVCGICQCSPEETGLRRLVVDHEHVTGRVRGLLCQPCNLGLGHFRDKTSVLHLAIKYLDLQLAT
jgi:hypothetical protein